MKAARLCSEIKPFNHSLISSRTHRKIAIIESVWTAEEGGGSSKAWWIRTALPGNTGQVSRLSQTVIA